MQMQLSDPTCCSCKQWLHGRNLPGSCQLEVRGLREYQTLACQRHFSNLTAAIKSPWREAGRIRLVYCDSTFLSCLNVTRGPVEAMGLHIRCTLRPFKAN